ncbi:N-acetyltransferase [Arthrobacter sp. B1805]|uniref:GNAT family N-acetyltransferase n=1 Tax=Arthrobacter sp. B1805 TaxID=2058892 RepID=UPI000CE40624|nr:GNAT family N-acetyltransferase [Arthrobacter sp. B1805]
MVVVADVTIRRTTEDDWRHIRELRLEMLEDTPHAFLETLATALKHGEEEWRRRGRRGQSATGTSVAAIDGTGRWVGTMGGLLKTGTDLPTLYGVYVSPSHRGREAGVTDALLDEVEAWAAMHAPALRLTVHEDNRRAQEYYSRRGYRFTGRTEPYVLDPDQRELEMTRILAAGPGDEPTTGTL